MSLGNVIFLNEIVFFIGKYEFEAPLLSSNPHNIGEHRPPHQKYILESPVFIHWFRSPCLQKCTLKMYAIYQGCSQKGGGRRRGSPYSRWAGPHLSIPIKENQFHSEKSIIFVVEKKAF